jgi:hypothetical protein
MSTYHVVWGGGGVPTKLILEHIKVNLTHLRNWTRGVQLFLDL